MNVNAYQDAQDAWHRERFPNASATLIALKACEEMGEVAAVVVKAEGSERLVEEVGDVLNVLAVLLARYGRSLSEAFAVAERVRVR